MRGPILILGASSGIGEACARRLSTEGLPVVLVARNAQKLEQLKQELPFNAYTFPFDLQDVNGIKSIFEFCRQNSLLLEGMIYCVGMDATYPIKGLNLELMERVMRVNCLAFFEAGKHFANRRYSADRSKIVAISSSASVHPEKGMGLYAASKAALNIAVKTMAQEYIRRGILVNAVLPAGVLTPMAVQKMRTLNEEVPENIDAAIRELENNPVPIIPDAEQPYGIIPPSSIASLVAWLVSQENRYITGALIPVSAGAAL